MFFFPLLVEKNSWMKKFLVAYDQWNLKISRNECKEKKIQVRSKFWLILNVAESFFYVLRYR